MTVPLLTVRGVDYAYPGGVMALRNLNLTVEKGQKLAILGPNGSGKTTLLLHLNGAFQPTCGEIRLEDRPAGYDRRSLTDWRRRVGLVLQEPDDQLFAATVGQDVSFGPLNLGLTAVETRERVGEALAALRIDHLADRATHTLSFGQKKRVAMAGVLAMRPEILALDEPTAGLDSHGVAHLLDALQRLHEAERPWCFRPTMWNWPTPGPIRPQFFRMERCCVRAKPPRCWRIGTCCSRRGCGRRCCWN
jgi:cobalt/nickel transport system ATP-binding protein